ncbi:hypothetical protein RQL61_26690 [Citrobacter freundii]|uniref:hypothetical protein n=1 Tax=Citrobacter freundii TaxID=546 RepID=UPI0028C0F5DB|nr:hypothetical protein [Citrobacter freundii]
METAQQAISNTPGLDSLITLVASLQLRQTPIGRTSFVVTSKGDEVKTGFKVVNASSLIISNNLDGTINPAFPTELQPRDRTRMSSKIQVSKIAGNLRPAQLTDSGLSSHGAPIVGPDNVVESGNGRSMGILRAYEQGQADSYRQYLIDHAADYGVKAEDIARMDMPVLVRERVTDVDRAQFARDSNLSDLQEMAASEKAFVDAEMLDERLMAMFSPSEEGNLLARSNDGFIQSFMREIGDTATAGLVTTDGRPTKQLIDRIQNAIFAKAYKDERLVKMVAEEPDPEMRNILTALNTAASDFAQMQMLSGDVHKEAVNGLLGGIEEVDGLDKQAIAALQEAINLVRRAKDSGQAIEEVIAQQGLFEDTSKEAEALALFIVANSRSSKRIGAAFKKMAQKINDELIHQQQALGDMFGGGSLSLVDVLSSVSTEIEDEFGEGKGLNFAMFESAPGDNRAYISQMITSATSVDELVNVIKMTGKLAKANPNTEENLARLSASVGRNMLYSQRPLIQPWVEAHGYSGNLLGEMATSSENSAFYYKALQEAIKNNEPAPSLADARNIDYRVKLFLEASEGGASPDRLFMLMHKLEDLMQSDLSWQELRKACRTWLDKFMKMPHAIYAKVTSKFDKKLADAKSIPETIAALQWAIAAGKKALTDISDVMESGKASLDAVGLSKDFSGDELADAYIDVLRRLKALAETNDKDGRLKLPEEVDYYIEQINKVRDRPEKLKPYLKDVFTPHGGIGLEVDRLKWFIDRESDEAVQLYELERLFKDKAPYPPLIVEKIHSKVKAAMDAVMQASPVSKEDAEAWGNAIELDSDIIEKTTVTAGWRTGYDARDVAEKVFTLTGGKLDTLKKIEHQAKVRASASQSRQSVTIDADTDAEHVMWHELGHHVEFSNPHLLERAKGFIKSKTEGRLVYSNFGGYGDAEYKVKTSLSHYYMSKIYMDNRVSLASGKLLSKAPSLNNCRSTEVFSMALQCYADPELTATSYLNGDGIIEFLLGCFKELQNAH